MRNVLTRSGRRLSVGWLWPLVLLALSTCTNDFDRFVVDSGEPFEPGDEPLTSAVMCDIPQLPPDSLEFLCAGPTDIAIGMPDSQGAVALNLGDSNSVVLDYSDAAFNQCGAGNPRRIDFHDAFPNGTAVCLNCLQQIPSKYADPNAVCVAKCKELISGESALSTSQIDDFCANAHVSTNFDATVCVENVCTTGGMPLSPFPDSRVNPEDVIWVDPINAHATGSTLSFDGPVNPDPSLFNGGAASEQIILHGDAWVEFRAGDLNVSHVIGVRTSCSKAANCPDTDGTLADIPLVISLNVTGEVNIVQNGTTIIAGPFADYQLGERFRIHVVDKHDGLADISFTRLPAPCTPGSPCTETPLPLGTGTAAYPLQVDASFRELNASLTNVTIMRIKP